MFAHEICPNLKYLQMQTDYDDDKFNDPADIENEYPNVTELYLRDASYGNSKLTIRKLENLTTYFPKLSTLKVQKRRLNIREEEWNNLVLKTGIRIVTMTR